MGDSPRITVQWSPRNGRTRTCRFSSECTIGRAPSNRIIVPDAEVSRQHAALRVSNGRLLLHNLSQAGNVQVRSESLPPSQVTRLHTGDVVTIGSVSMTILDLKTSSTPAPIRCVNPTCNRTLTQEVTDCPWCGTSTAFADTHAGL